MQARVRFAGCPRNPLRRSCVSSARNAGESAICRLPAQTLCGDRACRVREMQARVRFAGCPRNPLRRSCVSSARNAGENAICRLRAQPSAEIARVECTIRRRECDWCGARATLCGDRARRVREMQARVRLGLSARNPLRRSSVSSARNAGESAIGAVRAQPSAEIVCVECAKGRRECDLPAARATLCGDRACRAREMQARVRLSLRARNPLRRSCASSARYAGESAIGSVRAQPSAEIGRVERRRLRLSRCHLLLWYCRYRPVSPPPLFVWRHGPDSFLGSLLNKHRVQPVQYCTPRHLDECFFMHPECDGIRCHHWAIKHRNLGQFVHCTCFQV